MSVDATSISGRLGTGALWLLQKYIWNNDLHVPPQASPSAASLDPYARVQRIVVAGDANVKKCTPCKRSVGSHAPFRASSATSLCKTLACPSAVPRSRCRFRTLIEGPTPHSSAYLSRVAGEAGPANPTRRATAACRPRTRRANDRIGSASKQNCVTIFTLKPQAWLAASFSSRDTQIGLRDARMSLGITGYRYGMDTVPR